MRLNTKNHFRKGEMVMLKRMESVWNNVHSLEYVNSEYLKGGSEGFILRPNSSDSKVQCAVYSPNNVLQKFTQLRIMLKGRCETLRFYFDVDSDVDSVLKELDFEHTEENVWNYGNRDFMVKATITPSFTEASLLLEIKSKRKAGIPTTATSIIMELESKFAGEFTEVAI